MKSVGKVALSIHERGYSSQILLNLELQYMMRCPRCTAFLKLPIYSCLSGHNYCNSCFEYNSNKCFQCPASKAPFRCTLLEQVHAEIRYPCKYTRKGCKRVLRGSLLHIHEYECCFRS